MKLRYIIIGIIAIVSILTLIATPAVNYDSVTCSYYGFPIQRYLCNDGNRFYTEQAMTNFYVPPMEQTQPDYTFVTGGQTEGFNGN